jgi:hypothetical protein
MYVSADAHDPVGDPAVVAGSVMLDGVGPGRAGGGQVVRQARAAERDPGVADGIVVLADVVELRWEAERVADDRAEDAEGVLEVWLEQRSRTSKGTDSAACTTPGVSFEAGEQVRTLVVDQRQQKRRCERRLTVEPCRDGGVVRVGGVADSSG